MVGTQFTADSWRHKTDPQNWRRGEGVEPSGDSISRQAGFEDRWGHRAPSSSSLYLLGTYAARHN
jgi:hypothetical protein